MGSEIRISVWGCPILGADHFNFCKQCFPPIFQFPESNSFPDNISSFIFTIMMIILLILTIIILKIIITMITGSASAAPLRIAHPLSRNCSCSSSPHGDQCSRHVEVATFLMTIMLFDDGESLTVLDCENEFVVFIFFQSQPNDCNQHMYCT